MTTSRPETLDAVKERLETLDKVEEALGLIRKAQAEKERRPAERIPPTAQETPGTTTKNNTPGSYGELWHIYDRALWMLYLTDDEETVLSHGRRYCWQWVRIRLGNELAPAPMRAEALRIIARAVRRRRAHG